MVWLISTVNDKDSTPIVRCNAEWPANPGALPLIEVASFEIKHLDAKIAAVTNVNTLSGDADSVRKVEFTRLTASRSPFTQVRATSRVPNDSCVDVAVRHEDSTILGETDIGWAGEVRRITAGNAGRSQRQEHLS